MGTEKTQSDGEKEEREGGESTADTYGSSHESLLKVLAWGVAAMLVVAGWFADPSTTHYIYENAQGEPEALDLVTVRASKIDGAYARGFTVLLAGIFGIVIWGYVALKINASCKEPKWLGDNAVKLFVWVAGTAFVLLLASVADVPPFE